MPNQVPQPRPQTPPNPAAAIGIPGAHTHTIIQNAHGQYSISPAAVANHQMGQHPPGAPMAAAPPPHQVQPGSQPGNPGAPGSIPQQPVPQTMTQALNKPYVKRARTNAISIVDPATMTAINTDAAQSAAAAATAQNEGSPAPSEVSPFCFVF